MAEAEEIDPVDGTITVDTLLQMDGAGISLPDIDHSMLAQLTDDEFVTLLVKVYTSRGTQYMNQHISKIAWRIKQLPGDKVSAYIFQIMQRYPISFGDLLSLVSRTPVDKLCSDRGTDQSSLALFIGFGHNGSNEGIVKKVNEALSPQIRSYIPKISNIILNTWKHPEWGAARMNKEITPEIAAMILQLTNEEVSDYIIGVLDHLDKDLVTVKRDIKSRRSTFSTFLGLGDTETTPGITGMLGKAITGKVKNFIPPVATFGFEAFLESNGSNAVCILLNTFKHPDWGAREMNRQMTPEIAAKILQLPNKDVVAYLIGGMNHSGKDIKTVREEIKKDTVRATERSLVPRGKGGASYSTYFGLGDESTNPGVAGKLGVAIGGVAIKSFVYIAPETTFGFEALVTLASSARQAAAEQAPTIELKKKKTTKKKKAQTKASKSPSSALPPSDMPSSKRMRSDTNNAALHYSSGDMESAVGSEMGNQKMPHRPPQQADAQVMHGSGGGKSDRAQAAKPSIDLYRSASREENNSNNINSSGGKMPSAFQSGQIGMPFGMATHQYPQQLQDFSLPNHTGGTEGAQNPWQMMMMTGNYNQGIQPQYGMVPTPQGFKMVPMVPMRMPPVGGIGTTSAQEGSATDYSLKTAKTSTPSSNTRSGRVGGGGGVLQQSVTGPAQEYKGRASLKSGEDVEEDSLAATPLTKATRKESDSADQSPSSTDDEIDSSDEITPNFNQIQDDETRIAHEKMKAFRSKTFEHDKQLPSNLCKKSVQNDPKKFKSYLLKLPNKENVKVIKLLGEGAYAATYHVKYKGKDCALKVQLTSEDDKADSLAMEFDYQLDLMYRVDQELGIIPIPMELHSFINGSLFFMSLENGKTLHHIATGPTLSLGVLVYLADLMLSTVVILHSKGHSHCDLKSDNIMAKRMGRNKVVVSFIDFGRAKKLTNLNTMYQGDAVGGDRSMMCSAMRRNKKWGVDQDMYGIAGVMHLLLFGANGNKNGHMKVEDTPIDEKTGRMSLTSQEYLDLSRNKRRQPDLWKIFFDELLNFDVMKYHETVQRIRKPLKDYMSANKRTVERNLSELSESL